MYTPVFCIKHEGYNTEQARNVPGCVSQTRFAKRFEGCSTFGCSLRRSAFVGSPPFPPRGPHQSVRSNGSVVAKPSSLRMASQYKPQKSARFSTRFYLRFCPEGLVFFSGCTAHGGSCMDPLGDLRGEQCTPLAVHDLDRPFKADTLSIPDFV